MDEMTQRVEGMIRAQQTVLDELEGPLALVEGAYPAGLEGVLYRNGPGRLERGGLRYGHVFDGDGMVLRFEFSAAGVRYRNRFVRTRSFNEEEAAGRILYRSFGTNIPGGFRRNVLRMRFKNPANTGVLFHGGKLLCMNEAGLPHEVDAVTLETRGPYDYGGRLIDRSSRLRQLLLGAALPFSAHPRIDPETGEAFNFGVTMDGTKSALFLYRIDPRGCMDAPQRIVLESGYFVHDCALTPRHLVFFLCPAVIDAYRLVLGVTTISGAVQFSERDPVQVLIVPRDGASPSRVELPACFVFHLANAFERGRDRIVVDACRHPTYPSDFARFGDARLSRFVIDLSRGDVQHEPLVDLRIEVPTIDQRLVGKPHRHVFASGRPPGPATWFTAVARIDVEQKTSILRDFAPDWTGEPIFVPRPGSTGGDGWVLVMIYDMVGRLRTDLLVLDAADLSTVARLRLPHHVPNNFHGAWVAASSLVAHPS